MKKIYHYFVNSGVWDECRQKYILAESKEEAMASDEYKAYNRCDFDVGEVCELSSDEICMALGLYRYKDRIKFSYEINED